MRKKLILFLSCSIMLTAMIPVVYAKGTNNVQYNANQEVFLLGAPFFQSYDDVFNQIKNMEQAVNGLTITHKDQNNGIWFDLMNLKSSLSSLQEIQIEERNNELTYKIKQPQGNDSKVDVSIKDGVLIINTHLVQKISHSENGSKSYSYSQSNYNQSFKLPKGYDPNSMDIKSKDANLIVTFKKITESSRYKNKLV